MRNAAVVTALALAAPLALADSITQDLNFNWSGDGPLEVGNFAGFDNAGGTRILTGVNIAIDAEAQWDLTFHNYSAEAFAADEWWGEGFANFNIHLGEFGSGAERIAGFIDFTHVTGELGAGSGDIFGEPGEPSVSVSLFNDIVGAFDLDASEFGVVTSGDVLARILGFTDVVVDGPNGAPGIIFGETDLLTVTGGLTLTYEYTIVPAPGAGALLGGLGMLATRRRRA